MAARTPRWVHWVPEPPAPEPEAVELGPCDVCLAGDHEACVTVNCYHCDHSHLRRHGSAATSDRDG